MAPIKTKLPSTTHKTKLPSSTTKTKLLSTTTTKTKLPSSTTKTKLPSSTTKTKLPTYLSMISSAIKDLGEREGSSRQAVTRAVLARYSLQPYPQSPSLLPGTLT